MGFIFSRRNSYPPPPHSLNKTNTKYVIPYLKDIAIIQRLLKQNNYYNGNIDGKCGRITAIAFNKFMDNISQRKDNKNIKRLSSTYTALNVNNKISTPQIQLAEFNSSFDLANIPTTIPVYNEVKLMQQKLKEEGLYNDKIDGKCGSNTAKAMLLFTTNAFGISNQAPYRINEVFGLSKSEILVAYQQMLVDARFLNIDRYNVSGVFDEQTKIATIKYIQTVAKNLGLYSSIIDGKIGPKTINAYCLMVGTNGESEYYNKIKNDKIIKSFWRISYKNLDNGLESMLLGNRQ